MCLSMFDSRLSSIHFIEDKFKLNTEDEFECMDQAPVLSDMQTSTVHYISGYIARKLRSSLDCKACTEALVSVDTR